MSSARASRHQKWRQTQPQTIRLTLKGLLSLPHRMLNPPPSVASARSCGVTPILKVKLEDVLSRKHLPPLGLKDFEEYLLFVELAPEYLYFTLWLREYTKRYQRWTEQRDKLSPRPSSATYRVSPPSQTSPALAVFYAKAKQTFFAPGAGYELAVPPAARDALPASSTLDANGMITGSATHPDPVVFVELASFCHQKLDDSLQRFLFAAYNNVGNNRAWCGFAAGLFVTLSGSLAPLALNFVRGDNRWERFVALPGMWLGLTLILASLHGVCLMIYFFGDLRQLRKFEMVRVTGSDPEPLDSVSSSREKKPHIRSPPPVASSVFTAPSCPVPSSSPQQQSAVLNARNVAFAGLDPIRMPTSPRSGSVSSLPSFTSPASPTFSTAPLNRGGPIAIALPEPPQAVIKRVRIESPPLTPDPSPTADAVPLPTLPTSRGRSLSPPLYHRPESLSSSSELSEGDSSEGEDGGPPAIEISPAFYDEAQEPDDQEGNQPRPRSPVAIQVTPDTLKALEQLQLEEGETYVQHHSRQSRPSTASSSTSSLGVHLEQWRTATFIRPYEYDALADDELSDSSSTPASRHVSIAAFDFEGLPPRIPRTVGIVGDEWASMDGRGAPPAPITSVLPWAGTRPGEVRGRTVTVLDFPTTKEEAPGPIPDLEHGLGVPRAAPARYSVRTFIGRLQERCAPPGLPCQQWVYSEEQLNEASGGAAGRGAGATATAESEKAPGHGHGLGHAAPTSARPGDERYAGPGTRRRLHEILSVPAFNCPLTRVLSPVVTRAQWEIVMRSTVVAGVVSATVCGALVGAPVVA